MANNSHFGIDQNLLRAWRFARLFGGLVTNAEGSPEAIRKQMILTIAAEWEKEDAYLHPLQQAFDAVDTPAIFNSLGCSIILE